MFDKDDKNTKKPIVEFKTRSFSSFKRDKGALSEKEVEKKEEALKRFKSTTLNKTEKSSIDINDPETKKRAAFFGDRRVLEQIRNKDIGDRSNNRFNPQNRKPFFRKDYVPNPNNRFGDAPKPDQAKREPSSYVPKYDQKPRRFDSAGKPMPPFQPRPYRPSGDSTNPTGAAPDSGNRYKPRTPYRPSSEPRSFGIGQPKMFLQSQPDTQSRPQQDRDKKAAPKKYDKPKRKLSAPISNVNPQITQNIIGRISSDDDHFDTDSRVLVKKARPKSKVNQVKRVVPKSVTIYDGITLVNLASLMSITYQEAVSKLKEIGITATKEQKLDFEIASFLVTEFGSTPKKRVEVLDKISIDTGLSDDSKPRAPIVTVVGHVDHGKTSLLDALRRTQVTAKESGGITQSIGASQVFNKDGKFITFIDTPGHAIFTEMRARGVNITDIVLLIIAADDGIKEQTIESIQHAKASEASIIVVITKVDKPGTNTEKIKNMLFNYGIAVESMGGDVPDIEVSAKTGYNLPELIDLILLQGELMELKAPVNTKAYGVVLESYLDKFKGPIANIIIKSGTLHKSDYFLTGSVHGKIKSITDWQGKQINEAGPSYPVQIMGLSKPVSSGSDFIVMPESDAKVVADKRLEIQSLQQSGETSLRFYSVMDIWRELTGLKEEKVQQFIVKADSYGSAEAVSLALSKLRVMDVVNSVLLKGVGAVSESDVMLAKASNAQIIGFKVDIPSKIAKLAKLNDILVRSYDIIYKIIEDIEKEITNSLKPVEELVEIGRAEVREIFVKHKVGTIAGCVVLDGIIKNGADAAVIRNGIEIYSSKVENLRQFRDDKREVKAGQQCGLMVANFSDFKQHDVIRCTEMRKIKEEE